jgi:K+-transporting ATPase ATPase C chain
MIKLTIQSILQTLLWTVMLGVLYPLVIFVFAQVVFPYQANGSLIKDKDGNIIGSELLAQQFTGDHYFWPRPSANGYGVAPAASGNSIAASSGSNFGPTSAKLQASVQSNAAALRKASNLKDDAWVPSDLVYASASGLDPDITPEAARFQISRVASARKLSEDKVKDEVEKSIKGAQFGIFGESRVNVLMLNLALDNDYPDTKPAITPPPAPAPTTPAATTTPAAAAAPDATASTAGPAAAASATSTPPATTSTPAPATP